MAKILPDKILYVVWVIDEREGPGIYFHEFLASLTFFSYANYSSEIHFRFIAYVPLSNLNIYQSLYTEYISASHYCRNIFVEFKAIRKSHLNNVYVSKVDCLFDCFHEIFIANHDSTSLLLFTDCDCLALLDFITPLSSYLSSGRFDVAMSLECGALDLGFSPNYNTGIIFLSFNNAVSEVLTQWKHSINQQADHGSDIGDQHIFRSVLVANSTLRILTLHDTCNLRCHPVYDNQAFVWSPVSVVHNHEVTKLAYKCLNASRLYSKFSHSNEKNIFQGFSHFFNPISNEYSPRCLQIDQMQILNHIWINQS